MKDQSRTVNTCLQLLYIAMCTVFRVCMCVCGWMGVCVCVCVCVCEGGVWVGVTLGNLVPSPVICT